MHPCVHTFEILIGCLLGRKPTVSLVCRFRCFPYPPIEAPTRTLRIPFLFGATLHRHLVAYHRQWKSFVVSWWTARWNVQCLTCPLAAVSCSSLVLASILARLIRVQTTVPRTNQGSFSSNPRSKKASDAQCGNKVTEEYPYWPCVFHRVLLKTHRISGHSGG